MVFRTNFTPDIKIFNNLNLTSQKMRDEETTLIKQKKHLLYLLHT